MLILPCIRRFPQQAAGSFNPDTLRKIPVIVGLIIVLFGCGKLPGVVFVTDPLAAEEHNDLGVSYEQRGEYNLAEREYKEALRIKKDFFEAQFNLGNVYLKTGRENEAEEAYRRAIALDSARPDPYNNLASLYLRAERNIDEAQKLSERAVCLARQRHYLYLDTLGMAYLKQGKIEDALVHLEDALKSIPAENKALIVETCKHLADAYALRGEEKKALKYLDRVLELTGEKNSFKSPVIPADKKVKEADQ